MDRIKLLELNREKQRYREQELLGENEYIRFCVWCNAFNNFKGKDDAKVFTKYLNEQNVSLNFWQKKYLAEKYFGYVFSFDYEKKKWIVKKKI